MSSTSSASSARDGAPARTAAPPWSPPNGGDGVPPHARLLMLTNGKRISQVVYALAEAGVADAVAQGVTRIPELAEATGTHPDALRRVLRCAAAVGVFTLGPDGTVGLTETAEALRADSPDSQRDMVLFNGSDAVSRSYAAIMTTLRTGRPAFEEVFGATFFDHLRDDPKTAGLFDRAMSRMSVATTRMLLDSFDFGRFASVADIGGGQGYFLGELLARHPGTKGTLVDRPDVVAEAPRRFAERGVADRAEAVAGDFFEGVPGGHGLYVLKAVLHDWDDAAAVRILRGIRAAMGDDADARLAVLEHVVAPGDTWDQGKFLDIDMMLRFGGREREPQEWRSLLGSAGFELVSEPRTGGWAVLECRPVAVPRD